MKIVEGYKQAKEELEVSLKNKHDFDSIIEAKLTIFNKTINFLVPAIFVEYTNTRPEMHFRDQYEKNVVRPIFQFSSIHTATEVIPLEKEYEDLVEKGTVYARSKYN
jgi:hypothetical protein